MGQHLSANDVIPPLRRGLAAPSTSGNGEEMIDVGPLRMHAFELSIARMLDGRRTARDVVENCWALGLPMSLDALEDFVFQLREHGLLGEAPAGPYHSEAWQPAARDLYRDALKASREGEFDDARVYLDSLLQLQPGTPEAVHLKEWIDSHPDPHVAGRTFGNVFQRTIEGWAGERPPHFAAELRDTLRHSWWLPLGVLTAIGFLIAYAMMPVSHRVFAAAVLRAADTLPISSPTDGAVQRVFVAEGDRVEHGAPLVAFDAKELERRHAELTALLEKMRAPLRAAVAQTPDGAALTETVAAAEAEQVRAKAVLAREREELAGAPPNESTVGAERQLAMATEAVESARTELDALIPRNAPGAAAAQAVADQIKTLGRQLEATTVVAPVAGVVTRLGVKPGQDVKINDPLLQVEQRGLMKVEVTLPRERAASVAVGTPITIHVGTRGYSTTVSEVDGATITAELSNPDLVLPPGPMGVQIDLPPSSIMQRAKR